ncbi:MAG: DUF309 domain-containing protein [Acidobacteriota bacterium]|nr:DUF309 domain-containing protein [Acidobacteriota bacterium]
MKRATEYGIQLFDEQRFFEAHEALESVWLKESAENKTFLHGLIQIAAAFHHYSRSNLRGCRSLLNKGCEKLDACGDETFSAYGIDRRAFERQLDAWRRHLFSSGKEAATSPPPLPRIVGKKDGL